MAPLAAHPVALLSLVFVQGGLAFAVGSTVIARVLYAAAGAPTMGSSYATAALNVGAAAGPAIGAAAFAAGAGALAPVWIAVVLTGVALAVVAVAVGLPSQRVGAPERRRTLAR